MQHTREARHNKCANAWQDSSMDLDTGTLHERTPPTQRKYHIVSHVLHKGKLGKNTAAPFCCGRFRVMMQFLFHDAAAFSGIQQHIKKATAEDNI